MGKRIYIATSLDNSEQCIMLWQALKVWKPDLDFTYEWYHAGKVDLARYAEVSALEYNGVISADIFIMLCPGKKGSHTELGIALTTVPHVFVAGVKEELEPHATGYPSIFYYLPTVTRIEHDGTFDDLVAQVKEAFSEKVYSKD